MGVARDAGIADLAGGHGLGALMALVKTIGPRIFGNKNIANAADAAKLFTKQGPQAEALLQAIIDAKPTSRFGGSKINSLSPTALKVLLAGQGASLATGHR